MLYLHKNNFLLLGVRWNKIVLHFIVLYIFSKLHLKTDHQCIVALIWHKQLVFIFFSDGMIAEKLIPWRYFAMFFCFLALALGNGLLLSGDVILFMVLCFVNGGANGAIATGMNTLCLDIWRGRGGGHWMHMSQFSYAGGAFLGKHQLCNCITGQPLSLKKPDHHT